MTATANVQKQLTDKFGEDVYGFTETYGMLSFEANPAINLKVLNFLNDTESLRFTFLNDLTAIHYPDRTGKELMVVYLLQNIRESLRVRFKISVPVDKPEVFSATSIFATANWLEREAYDFFGVQFIGHPNLIRIMNVDEMDYHPLRKEFPLEDQRRMDKDDDMFGR